ncbi:GDP-fucose transporter 1-like [Tachypleus tridentatus]|uniref:GDP-fucose transporter 1-like n=1 Tax=Tachypleus tridentatus TaxID=6853 RepID=UPI003FD1CA7A
MENKEKHPQMLVGKYIQVTGVVAAYWVISMSFVFLNRYLLSGSEFKLDVPVFVTFYQCLVTVGLCLLLSGLSRVIPFPNIKVKLAIMKEVFPLSIVFVGMITFNNLCLKDVGVPFYYIGRSLSTVFNVIFTYYMLQVKTSPKAVICCIVIVSGFCIGVDQENSAGNVSVMGIIYGILASICVSLNSIYTKKILPKVGGNIWILTFYSNLNALFLFLPIILFTGELSVLLRYRHLLKPMFWTLMSVGGVFGFAIGYVTGLQIKVTSPLTHNISGTAKACAQTLLAVIWFQEVKSTLWWVSNAVVLVGSSAYTRIKQVEMQKAYVAASIYKDGKSVKSTLV